MATVTELHIWMQNHRETWEEPEVINPHSDRPQPGKRIVLEVDPGTSIPELKVAVAKELEKWWDQLAYYYVVAQVEKSDGTFAYRTIVGKVYPQRDKKKRGKKK